jgi:hypothetical protein
MNLPPAAVVTHVLDLQHIPSEILQLRLVVKPLTRVNIDLDLVRPAKQVGTCIEPLPAAAHMWAWCWEVQRVTSFLYCCCR